MLRSHLRIPLILLFSSALFGCPGDEEKECFDDRSCPSGQRCVAETLGQKGICGPCDATEIPYDGVDNDCNPGTRDRDLDGDGENPPEGGGNDCDDTDDTVSSLLPELCSDTKDNDCDGQVDEPDCGDMAPATFTWASPAEGELVLGSFDVIINFVDDVGVTNVQLFINNAEIDSRTFSPTLASGNASFTVDSVAQGLPDGPTTVRIDVTDVKGNLTTDMRTVFIDNITPPAVTPVAPVANQAYGGTLLIEMDIQDGAGVADVMFIVDTTTVATFTSPPYEHQTTTATMAEGDHVLRVIATDNGGNQGITDIAFSVDNTDPGLSFAQPAAGATVDITGTMVQLNYADQTNVREVFLEGVSYGQMLSFNFLPTGLPSGMYTLTASASDDVIIDNRVGGHVAVATVDVNIVNNGPTVTLNFMNGDAVLGETEIIATANAPPGKLIATVDIDVDGNRLIAAKTGNEYTAETDFTLHPGPTATINVLAIDSDGNSASASANVILSELPTFRIARNKKPGGNFSTEGMTVGHVNNDGIADLVIGTNGDIRIMYGSIVDGDWVPRDPEVFIATGSDLLRLYDSDGDGNMELFSLRTNTLSMYGNDGVGLNPIPIATAVLPIGQYKALEVGDFDGDGDGDVVAGGASGFDFVLVPNDANAGFLPDIQYGLVGNVQDLEVGDADNDGDLDVVVGRTGMAAVLSTYRNITGDGVFGAGQDSFSTAGDMRYVAIGDLTGDGFPDAVGVVSTYQNTQLGAVTFLVGNAATPGTFTEAALMGNYGGNFIINKESRHVDIADIDEDGDNDIIIASYINASIEVIRFENGAFDSHDRWVLGRRAQKLHLFDLDNDNDLDVVVQASQDKTVAWAENLGGGDMFAARAVQLEVTPFQFAAADIVPGTGDGLVDLVVASGSDSKGLYIYQNLGQATFNPANPIISSWGERIIVPRSIAIGDLDGQNGLDVTIGSDADGSSPATGDGSGVIMVNNGAGAMTVTHMDLERPWATYIDDVDNDGNNEVLFSFRNVRPGMQRAGGAVYTAAGNEIWSRSEGLEPVVMTAGDLGNDVNNWTDFAWANNGSEDITVAFYAGTDGGGAAIWNTTSFTALPGIEDLQIGFVGNDAFADLIAVGEPGLIILEGAPGNAFLQPISYGIDNDHPISLIAADFNDDMLNDAIATDDLQDRAAGLIARPTGGFHDPYFFPTCAGSVDLTKGDLDGDGTDDLAVLCRTSGQMMLVFSNADQL